ncbi:uncharacterized protein EV422DRAFT_568992 [Fimicolochytrium jonesii]|uniref:uncharacterized protein n=1 Tax=Fimicolochytrium jonesii TaxID=1396493 RepID=UPI0022FE876D|nr:uncharacterized protein EV422DRAFT_568992 [Fimicolochytrium jonesii]KAI8819132.1 hypothetical protein EV422DRAFT_568992 [Fimicolochytrium jonesii]
MLQAIVEAVRGVPPLPEEIRHAGDSPAVKTPTVLIIGAGIGGLALAQALRKQGISYQIFERDASAEIRPQGWALSMNWILGELLPAFSLDLPPLAATAVEAELGLTSESAFYDANTKEVLWRGGNNPRSFLRVNRAALRSWLMSHIDVTWGKQFSRYETESNGLVTAHFEDGTTATGHVLVGADGVRSRVRDQVHAPSPPPLSFVPVGILVGEFDVLPADYDKFMALGRSSCMAYGKDRRLFIAPQYIRTEKARYYWILSWTDPTTADAKYWTDLQEKTPTEWLEMAKTVVADMHPDFKEIVEKQDPAQMLPPFPVRDQIPAPLPAGNVTLIGDAFHPMTFFRGEGAQQALKDALEVAKALNTSISLAYGMSIKPQTPDFSAALKTYEDASMDRITSAVLRSREAATDYKFSLPGPPKGEKGGKGGPGGPGGPQGKPVQAGPK